MLIIFKPQISDNIHLNGKEFPRSSKDYTMKQIPQDAVLKILDVGCGTGLNSDYLSHKLKHNLIGIDISYVSLIKYHKKRMCGLQCDVNRGLPFRSSSFDLVFGSEVMEHLYDTSLFLTESLRVLKPGGIILLSVPNSAFWVYRLLGLAGMTVSEIQHPGHIRFFTKRSLLEYIRQSGFILPVISGRNMYILIGDSIGKYIQSVLIKFGFYKEYRFQTGKYFWHRSNYVLRSSGFWTDTLILKAKKPE